MSIDSKAALDLINAEMSPLDDLLHAAADVAVKTLSKHRAIRQQYNSVYDMPERQRAVMLETVRGVIALAAAVLQDKPELVAEILGPEITPEVLAHFAAAKGSGRGAVWCAHVDAQYGAERYLLPQVTETLLPARYCCVHCAMAHLGGPYRPVLDAVPKYLTMPVQEPTELDKLRNEKEAGKFWSDLFAEIDDARLLEKMKAELADYYFMLNEVPLVYMHVTGQRMSKTNYFASSVISVADQYSSDCFLEDQACAVADEREACAKIADTGMLQPPDGGSPTEGEIAVAKSIAASIRARGGKNEFPRS